MARSGAGQQALLLLVIFSACSLARGASPPPVTPRCRPTFGYNPTTRKCVPCASPFCWRCQADYRRCTECVQPFYSFVSGDWSFYLTPQGRCNRCTARGCSKGGTCNPDGTCRTCDEGFGLVGKQCLKCKVANCGQCTGNVTRCSSCGGENFGDYYRTATGQCKECFNNLCDTFVDGSACNPDGSCKKCTDGYVKQGTKCVKAQEQKCLTRNCVSCTADLKTCLDCDASYFLSAQKACLPCKGECGLCNPRNPAQCTACYLGYGLVTATKKCVKCPAAKHCSSCNGDGQTCDDCYIGEGPNGKGGCEDCRDPACLRCDASSTQCTECASKRSVTEGSTPYFYYYQLDRAGKKCVRIFREKNTIPPDEYF